MAEDIVQDTLLVALTRWSRDGVPENPAAWLTSVAKRHSINVLRHYAVTECHALLEVAIGGGIWTLASISRSYNGAEERFERTTRVMF